MKDRTEKKRLLPKSPQAVWDSAVPAVGVVAASDPISHPKPLEAWTSRNPAFFRVLPPAHQERHQLRPVQQWKWRQRILVSIAAAATISIALAIATALSISVSTTKRRPQLRDDKDPESIL